MDSVLLQEVFTPAMLVNVPKQYKISASELNSFPRGEELGRHVKMLFYYRGFTLCLLGRSLRIQLGRDGRGLYSQAREG